MERRERPAIVTSKKPAPPQEQTHAENYYYLKQMQSKTPMTLVLRDGELLNGIIEWYDKACIKLSRNGGGTVVVYKPCIKYMYKQSEAVTRK